MRLLRITTNYLSYLKQFYAQRPELGQKNYAVQYQTMVADCFGWADFWTHFLSSLGYEVWEPIANTEPMQTAWARENGINFREKYWLNDILSAQVKLFKPDVLFVDDCLTFASNFVNYLRQENSSIKLVLGWCGAPYENDSIFNSYDLVLSNIPELVRNFRQQGHNAEYMQHAFDSRIVEKLKNQPDKTVDFSFIGSILKGKSNHLQRERLIKELVKQTNIQIWSDLSSSSPYNIRLLGIRQLAYDLIKLMNRFPLATSRLARIPKIRRYVEGKKRPSLSDYIDSAIVSRAHSPLFGLAMFQQLHNSKVTFNNHIDISSKSASNMRLFEATGVGTCLLTDWKENLHELFAPETEVVTYRSAEECIEKVKWLLDHPQEREVIARAGQARTLREHTFVQRAIQLNEIIYQAIKSK